jgi:hypothetical protein
MNLEKVVFGFFILLAATLNFGFVYGDLSNPDHHNVYEWQNSRRSSVPSLPTLGASPSTPRQRPPCTTR